MTFLHICFLDGALLEALLKDEPKLYLNIRWVQVADFNILDTL
jgi:hypothetical protein